MLKLYLAHPVTMRKEIRQLELEIEKQTGIELINPFYDTERDDIEKIDSGQITRESASLNPGNIVGKDLGQITMTDGVVAYLTKETHQIGTICEIWYCSQQAHKPIYVVSTDCLMHPWVRFMVESSGGKGFNKWEEFIGWVEDNI